MKKKSDKQKVDNELDFDDMSEFDDDLDFGDLNDVTNDRNPSSSGISKEMLKEAGTGFLDGLVKKTAEKSLPESYSRNYSVAMDYADFTRETFDRNKTKIDRSLYRLGREVKKILPFQFNMLNNFLSKYETDFEELKTQTEEQLRENSIQSNLDSIFNKNLEVQKAIEAKRSAEEEVSKKEQLGFNKINLDVLTSIDTNVGTQTSFTLQISKEYYRKSLELQYKSYFIQADMLKTMRDYYKSYSIQFDNIVKNTGLPDFVKLKTSENFKEILRNNAITSVYQNLFNNSNYVQGVKKRLSSVIDGKINDLTDSIDTVTDLASGINDAGSMGGGSMRVIGNLLSGMLGSTLGEKTAEKIAGKFKKKIEGNKTIAAGGNYLDLAATSPSSMMSALRAKVQNKADEYSDGSTISRSIIGKVLSGASDLLSVTGQQKIDTEIKKPNILTHAQPAIFDNKVHRSISEVIPMYLSKILTENTNLRLMYKTVNQGKLIGFTDQTELVYNYQDRKLGSVKEFKESVSKSLNLQGDKKKNKINRLTSTIDQTSRNVKNLSKEDSAILKNNKSRKAFESYVQEASITLKPEDFTYDNLVKNYKKIDSLKEVVAKNPGLATYLETIAKVSTTNVTKQYESLATDVSLDYPITAVIELFKTASKLSGSKYKNNLKPDVAQKISKAIMTYLMNSSTDVTIESIISGSCFRYLKSSDHKLIKKQLVTFILEVKRVVGLDDMEQLSILRLAIGVMNKSLRDQFEINPEIFKELNQYSPILQEHGNLTIENLIEGKLGKVEQEETIDPYELRQMTKVKDKKRQSVPAAVGNANILSQIENSSVMREVTEYSNIFSTFGKDIKNASGLKDVSNSISKMVSSLSIKMKENGAALYKKATSELDKVNTYIKDTSKIGIEKTKVALIEQLTKYIENIDKVIELEKENQRTLSNEINMINRTVNDNVNDQSTQRTVSKSTAALLKTKEVEIKTLIAFKKKLIDTRKGVMSIETKEIDIQSFMSTTKSIFTNLLEEAKTIMNQLESDSQAI